MKNFATGVAVMFFVLFCFLMAIFAMFWACVCWLFGAPVTVNLTRTIAGVEVPEKRKYRWFKRIA